ncbi:MAG TPA: hypothetical protein VEG44_06195 [Candidatus Acidoferrales bacterium]|nr:hypothetical protein [Candidatus Acidoferrales bacterium]
MERDRKARFNIYGKRSKDDRDKDDGTKYSRWKVLPNESYKWDFILQGAI